MYIRFRFFLPVLLFLLLPTLSFADHGNSSSHGNNQGRSVTRVRLTLDPAVGSMASGRYDRQTRTRGGSITKDDFQVRVAVPVPSTLPALTAAADSKAADVRLVFLRSNIEYAQCAMKASFDSSDGAQYRLLIKQLPRGGVRNYKGSCDLDLATDGVQSGLPTTESGDEVVVRIYVNGVGTDFLSGLLP